MDEIRNKILVVDEKTLEVKEKVVESNKAIPLEPLARFVGGDVELFSCSVLGSLQGVIVLGNADAFETRKPSMLIVNSASDKAIELKYGSILFCAAGGINDRNKLFPLSDEQCELVKNRIKTVLKISSRTDVLEMSEQYNMPRKSELEIDVRVLEF